MKEIEANLWSTPADLRVITTNGVTRSDGAAVMGRGCALEAKRRITGLEYHFGKLLKEHGNRVMRLTDPKKGAALASFPVKWHWKEKASAALIGRSARQLVELADRFGYERIILPRAGCGNGGLSWTDVRPILEVLLDDRFTVVTFPTPKRTDRKASPPARRIPQDRAGASEPSRAIFCGSRNWKGGFRPIRRAIESLPEGTIVVHGGARGADRMAGGVAVSMGLPVEIHEPLWEEEGKAAGYKRNERMLGLPNVREVHAFRSEEESRGTDHTVGIAREAGVALIVYGEDGRVRERRPGPLGASWAAPRAIPAKTAS
ncbi:MAG: hypothetical protein M3Q49_11190 [Actinomycetota bacterium]|nr:hypothetical protein [Actinomycetota bacterium]